MENLAYKEPPRMERIDGKVRLMSPRPRVSHNRVSFRIAYIFARYLEGKTCVPFADGTDVHLDDENTYIPVQVDRGAKMRHYAAAGVQEYWIVSPLGRSVEVYYNHNGVFEMQAVYTDYLDWDLAHMDEEERQAVKTEIKVSLYEDFFVSVKEIFKDVTA